MHAGRVQHSATAGGVLEPSQCPRTFSSFVLQSAGLGSLLVEIARRFMASPEIIRNKRKYEGVCSRFGGCLRGRQGRCAQRSSGVESCGAGGDAGIEDEGVEAFCGGCVMRCVACSVGIVGVGCSSSAGHRTRSPGDGGTSAARCGSMHTLTMLPVCLCGRVLGNQVPFRPKKASETFYNWSRRWLSFVAGKKYFRSSDVHAYGVDSGACGGHPATGAKSFRHSSDLETDSKSFPHISLAH